MSVSADLISKSFMAEVKDAEQGTFSAVFSTFNVKDADGDVVRPGAIPDGIEVPIVWGHDWGMMPVGKGIIRVSRKNAVVDGRFNLATQQGREAWETLKFMGGVQQYSWGFQVTEHSFGEFEGEPVRFITGTRPMEVSPVLVGSNPQTGTISVKGAIVELKAGDTYRWTGTGWEEVEEAPAGETLKVDTESNSEPPVEEVGDWESHARVRLARARYAAERG